MILPPRQSEIPIGRTAAFFTLRTHGDRLIDREVRIWMTRMGVLVAISTVVESLTWGYTAFTSAGNTRPGIAAYLASVAVSLAVALLVWGGLEIPLATSDVRTLRAHWGTSGSVALLKTFGAVVKRHLGWALYAVRMAVILFTGLMTGPIVGTWVFTGKIAETAREHSERAWIAQRSTILAQEAFRLDSLRQEKSSTEAAKYAETAGTGASGIRGCGDACKTLTARIATLDGDIATNERGLRERLRLVDSTFVSGQVLSTLDLSDKLGILLSFRDPAVILVEALVVVFLALVYSGIVLLKVLQPRAVACYYDGLLQHKYRQYQRGTRKQRQIAAATMTGLEFEEYYRTRGRRLDDINERARELADQGKLSALTLDNLDATQKDIEAELEVLTSKLRLEEDAQAALALSSDQLDAAADDIRGDITQLQQVIQQPVHSDTGAGRLLALQYAAENKLAAARRRLADVAPTAVQAQTRLLAADAEVSRLQAAIASYAQLLAGIHRQRSQTFQSQVGPVQGQTELRLA